MGVIETEVDGALTRTAADTLSGGSSFSFRFRERVMGRLRIAPWYSKAEDEDAPAGTGVIDTGE